MPIPILHIDIQVDIELVNWKFTKKAKSISSKLEEAVKGETQYNEQEKYVGKIA